MNKDCLEKAKAALPDLSGQDLRAYAAKVYANAKAKGGNLKANLKDSTNEVNQQELNSMYEQAAVKLNNVAKIQKGVGLIQRAKANAREMLVRMNRNLSDNVESVQKSDINKMADNLFGKLDAKEMAYAANRSHDSEVFKVLDGERGSPESEKLASTLQNYIPFRNDELVDSNAMLTEDIRDDRFLRNNHNISRMVAGGRSLAQWAMSGFKSAKPFAKQRWVNFIKSKLDLEKTFKNTDAWKLDTSSTQPELMLDHDKVDGILSNIYDNITTGKFEVFTKSAAVNDADALAKKAHMFFSFKDWKSWGDYNTEYGTGDLFSAMMGDIHATGNKTGLSRVMGDNPNQAYVSWRAAQQRSPNLEAENGLWWRNTDHCYNEVTGANKTIVHPGVAQFMANIRSYTSMARLGALVVSSATDTNIAASYARRWGINYGKAFTSQLTALAKQYSDEDFKNFANLTHTNLKSHIGYAGKLVDSQNLGAVTSKVSQQYYKYTLMHGWDSGNRIGIMHSMAEHLGNMSGKEFNKLPQALQYQLNKFNISPEEWDAIRQNTNEGLITTDSASALSDDDIKGLQSKLGLSDQPLYQIRNDLYRKLYSVFDVASQNAILTPGAFEKAMMLQGSHAGTIPGEFMRMVMQFKGFPLSYINRQLVQGWQDADATQSKLGWALSTFAYILPLSYMSTMLYYAGNGQSMPDPEQMNFNDNLNFWASIAMPGLGVLSGVLDPQNQNQNLISSLAMTPSYRFFNDAISAPLATITGNPDKGAKDLKNALQYVIPGMTIPLASPYIKQFLGDKPYLQGGQQQLFGA